MTVKLILVRHGETEWNRKLKFKGSRDIELNETGREQAEKLAERLSKKEIDKIYTSDLKRAYNTGKEIAKRHDLEVEQIPDLKEISFGQWEGLTYKEIKEECEFSVDDWSKDPVNNSVPGGESLADVQTRVMPALEEIISKHQDEQIVIAAHGGVIKVLLGSLLEMPLKNCWSLEQDNTAVNIIKFYGEQIGFKLINSTAHLED